MTDLLPDSNHFARKLQAESRPGKTFFERFLGKQADALQDVAEIDSGSVHPHAHFVGAGMRNRDTIEDRAVLRFALAEGEGEAAFTNGFASGRRRQASGQTRRVPPPAAQQDFILVVGI